MTPKGFPDGSEGKKLPTNAGDTGDMSSVSGGRSHGEGNGNPLQYSCPENPYGQRSLGRLQSKGSQSRT